MSAKLGDDFTILDGTDEPQLEASGGGWLTLAICNERDSLALFMDAGEGFKNAGSTSITEVTVTDDLLTLRFTSPEFGDSDVSFHRSYAGSPNTIHLVDFSAIGINAFFQLNFFNSFQNVRSSGWRFSG